MLKKIKVSKKRFVLGSLVVLILFLAVGSLVWPNQFNDKANFLKDRINPYIGQISLANLQEIYRKPFDLGMDFAGGTRLVYRPVLKDSNQQISDEILIGIQKIIEQRFEIYGQSAQVMTENKNIVIEADGSADIGMIKEIINQEFSFEFREETDENFFKSTDLNGTYLESVSFSIDQTDQKPLILLGFNEEGAQILEALTKRNEGKRLAVYVDGVPAFPLQINEAVSGGTVQIKMDAEIEPVRGLTQMMAASSMTQSMSMISENTRTGEDAQILARNTVKAFLFVILIAFWILFVFYRLTGLISFVLLSIYILLFLLFFKLCPVVVDFGSISGLAISSLIAFSSLLLFSKNFKKEMIKGKSYGIALEEIIDSQEASVKRISFTAFSLIFVLFLIAEIFSIQNIFAGGLAFISFIGLTVVYFFLIPSLKKVLMMLENVFGRISFLWK